MMQHHQQQQQQQPPMVHFAPQPLQPQPQPPYVAPQHILPSIPPCEGVPPYDPDDPERWLALPVYIKNEKNAWTEQVWKAFIMKYAGCGESDFFCITRGFTTNTYVFFTENIYVWRLMALYKEHKGIMCRHPEWDDAILANATIGSVVPELVVRYIRNDYDLMGIVDCFSSEKVSSRILEIRWIEKSGPQKVGIKLMDPTLYEVLQQHGHPINDVYQDPTFIRIIRLDLKDFDMVCDWINKYVGKIISKLKSEEMGLDGKTITMTGVRMANPGIADALLAVNWKDQRGEGTNEVLRKIECRKYRALFKHETPAPEGAFQGPKVPPSLLPAPPPPPPSAAIYPGFPPQQQTGFQPSPMWTGTPQQLPGGSPSFYASTPTSYAATPSGLPFPPANGPSSPSSSSAINRNMNGIDVTRGRPRGSVGYRGRDGRGGGGGGYRGGGNGWENGNGRDNRGSWGSGGGGGATPSGSGSGYGYSPVGLAGGYSPGGSRSPPWSGGAPSMPPSAPAAMRKNPYDNSARPGPYDRSPKFKKREELDAIAAKYPSERLNATIPPLSPERMSNKERERIHMRALQQDAPKLSLSEINAKKQAAAMNRVAQRRRDSSNSESSSSSSGRGRGMGTERSTAIEVLDEVEDVVMMDSDPEAPLPGLTLPSLTSPSVNPSPPSPSAASPEAIEVEDPFSVALKLVYDTSAIDLQAMTEQEKLARASGRVTARELAWLKLKSQGFSKYALDAIPSLTASDRQQLERHAGKSAIDLERTRRAQKGMDSYIKQFGRSGETSLERLILDGDNMELLDVDGGISGFFKPIKS